jgi:carboxylesterase type B
VAINYRLNIFGFLSSRELIEEARSVGGEPISNQGLNDQRIALQWIQSSICHFGGDASKITLSGESAGAASVLCHLKGPLQLFQQAFLQSPPAPRLRTPWRHKPTLINSSNMLGFRRIYQSRESSRHFETLLLSNLLTFLMGVFPFLSKTLSGLKVMTEIVKTHPHSREIFPPDVAGLSLAMFEMNQHCF